MEKNLIYNFWVNNAPKEVKTIIKNYSPKEIEIAFSKHLGFGTAGIRAPMGYGTALLNEFIVAKVALAFGKWLIKTYPLTIFKNGIVIAHDNRKNGIKFSETFAEVLAVLKIPVYFFSKNKPVPTPFLSSVIATNHFVGGVNITASHNPAVYNGIKVYNDLGSQLLPKETKIIENFFNRIENPFTIPKLKVKPKFLTSKYETSYLKKIQTEVPFEKPKSKKLRIIFSANNGTSGLFAKKLLTFSKTNYKLVKEQCFPSETFINTPFPNPQDPQSFDLAKRYAKKWPADLLFATDPDADRFAVVLYDKKTKTWKHFNGNELPLLQFYYKLTRLKELHLLNPKKDFAIRSIVTSQAGDKVGKLFRVPVYNSLTGFKWLINRALEIIETENKNLLFAWEESYGSTIRLFTRDKDSFQALVQVIEMTEYYRKQGLTLLDVLNQLYSKIGYYQMGQVMRKFAGINGLEEMDSIINRCRNFKVGDYFGKYKITKLVDLNKSSKKYLRDNVFFIYINTDSFICLRPSGTEPYLRIYYDIVADNEEQAKIMTSDIINLIKKI